jgi:hypothetical protein
MREIWQDLTFGLRMVRIPTKLSAVSDLIVNTDSISS